MFVSTANSTKHTNSIKDGKSVSMRHFYTRQKNGSLSFMIYTLGSLLGVLKLSKTKLLLNLAYTKVSRHMLRK